MQTGFRHGISGRGCRLNRLFGPHRSDIDDGAASMLFHVFCNGLGDKEKALVKIKVFIIVRLAVLQKFGWIEGSGGVDQIINVAGLIVQTLDKIVNLTLVIKIDACCLN